MPNQYWTYSSEWVRTNRIAALLWRNVLECNGEMDQEKINVPQTPRLILGFDHVNRMLSGMVVIPELCGDEDVSTFH